MVDAGVLGNKDGLLSLTLPAASSVGAVIRIAGMHTAGSWKVVQGAAQYIRLGSVVTTVGAAGYLASTVAHDAVEMVCIEADLGWLVVSSVGNLEYA